MSEPTRRPRVSSALAVYVVLLVSMQIFLVAVAVDALQSNDATLAWTAAATSALLFGGSILFTRALRSPAS